MARITIQDCLKTGHNKFALVHLAAERVFQLKKEKEPLISTSNKEVVAALREIAAGKMRIKKPDNLLREDLTPEDSATAPEGPTGEDNTEASQTEDSLDKPR
jgi:DNA-directed RNA polymerase subunit omega